MKGIILAGGSGTRLYPITKSLSKQLMPVYDKPMIYYPLSVLMLAGIKEVLIICTPRDIESFKDLLGDGSNIGIEINYTVQPSPDGLAQSFILGKSFIGDDSVCLILGDNIFYGFKQELLEAIKNVEKDLATVYGSFVEMPERYGVAIFDKDQKVLKIEEKPIVPKSNYAITGLYFYPNDVIDKVELIKPSARGELEITDLNNLYLREERLQIVKLERGFVWFDTGTQKSYSNASNFIEAVETRQGLKVGCIEEVAYEQRFITKNQLYKLGKNYKSSEYGQYLIKRSKEFL